MMSIIHFLNVKNGDCSIIEHTSGNISVIDICNGNDEFDEKVVLSEAKGNFGQKKHPENPISYLHDMGKEKIFRFILTHPDMDHMDGFKRLFTEFKVINFWDIENNKKIENFREGVYKAEDWTYYQLKRKNALHFYDGARALYFNSDESGGNGDYLQIFCPTKDLIKKANENGEYNNASYVLLYNEFGRKILFPGDSEKEEWDILLKNHKSDLTDIDILIAPHHGRTSGGNDEFLKVLRPKLTLFGNAKSKDLNYDAWNNLHLLHYTNNQGGTFLLNIRNQDVTVYCANETFARSENKDTKYNEQLNAWLLRVIK